MYKILELIENMMVVGMFGCSFTVMAIAWYSFLSTKWKKVDIGEVHEFGFIDQPL